MNTVTITVSEVGEDMRVAISKDWAGENLDVACAFLVASLFANLSIEQRRSFINDLLPDALRFAATRVFKERSPQ